MWRLEKRLTGRFWWLYIAPRVQARVQAGPSDSPFVHVSMGCPRPAADRYTESLTAAGLGSGFTVFVQTIPSRFYPIAMLLFVFVMLLLEKEFGPMLEAEQRAQGKGPAAAYRAAEPEGADPADRALEPPAQVPLCWWNGCVPILVTVVCVLLGLVLTGYHATVDAGGPVTAADIFGNGDSYLALMWASFAGSATTWVMSRLQYYDPLSPSPTLQWPTWRGCRCGAVGTGGPRPLPDPAPYRRLQDCGAARHSPPPPHLALCCCQKGKSVAVKRESLLLSKGKVCCCQKGKSVAVKRESLLLSKGKVCCCQKGKTGCRLSRPSVPNLGFGPVGGVAWTQT